MRPSDVVITGVGLVTSLGATAAETAGAWLDRRTASIAALPELAGTPLESAPAALLPEFDAAGRLGGRRMIKYMSQGALLGCMAAREALAMSRASERFLPERIGIFAGNGLAAANVTEVRDIIERSIDETGNFSDRLFGERGIATANPLLSFKILANMPPCLVSIIEGIKGPNVIYTPWEGHTAAAMLDGMNAVACGLVDCALVGGADTPSNPATYAFLRSTGLIGADDFPAAGAGYIVIEKAETAASSGTKILARLDTIEMSASTRPASDPLSSRLGRTYAASPAILMGIHALAGGDVPPLTGADGQDVRISLTYPEAR
ncbi:MAG: hypothetical protein HZA22_10900 [Nitrospirae bacterium]|nr:hypothetical protein [Nitrospirota bacterium]